MNTLAVVADDGVILVDTMRNGWWGQALEAALREVTDKPVTTIINTNSHLPHSGNNHRFVKAASSSSPTSGRGHGCRAATTSRARAPGTLPQTTFRDRLTLMRGKERIDLYHFGPANTDGDAWVVFPSRRIMHVGDIVKKDEMLEITPNAGGSGVSYAETLALAIATSRTSMSSSPATFATSPCLRPSPWSELGKYQSKASVMVDAVRKAMTIGRQRRSGRVHAFTRTALFSRYKPEDVTPRCGPFMPSWPGAARSAGRSPMDHAGLTTHRATPRSAWRSGLVAAGARLSSSRHGRPGRPGRRDRRGYEPQAA